MKQKTRLAEIDILKAIGIILMVYGHAGSPGTGFVFLFHMAIFFMASGFCFSSKSSDDFTAVRILIKNKVLRLWLPYFLCISIAILLNNVMINLNIYTNDSAVFDYVGETKVMNLTKISNYMSMGTMLKNIAKAAIFQTKAPIVGAMWFLGTLFLVSVGYCLVDFVIKKTVCKNTVWIQCAVAVIALVVGYICKQRGHGLLGFARAATAYFLFHLGYLLRYTKVFERIQKKSYYLIMLIVSFLVLILLYVRNPGIQIDLNHNRFPNIQFLIAASLCGWCLVYSLSYFILFTPMKRGMVYIGQNTMSILILQYPCFKLAALLIIIYYQLPMLCLAAFPHLYGDKGWWPLYTVLGVTGPLLLNAAYQKVKGMFSEKWRGEISAAD